MTVDYEIVYENGQSKCTSRGSVFLLYVDNEGGAHDSFDSPRIAELVATADSVISSITLVFAHRLAYEIRLSGEKCPSNHNGTETRTLLEPTHTLSYSIPDFEGETYGWTYHDGGGDDDCGEPSQPRAASAQRPGPGAGAPTALRGPIVPVAVKIKVKIKRKGIDKDDIR